MTEEEIEGKDWRIHKHARILLANTNWDTIPDDTVRMMFRIHLRQILEDVGDD